MRILLTFRAQVKTTMITIVFHSAFFTTILVLLRLFIQKRMGVRTVLNLIEQFLFVSLALRLLSSLLLPFPILLCPDYSL